MGKDLFYGKMVSKALMKKKKKKKIFINIQDILHRFITMDIKKNCENKKALPFSNYIDFLK
jgi:hypothetical protein